MERYRCLQVGIGAHANGSGHLVRQFEPGPRLAHRQQIEKGESHARKQIG